MMSEVFETGGWFEQMIEGDAELRDMVAEDGIGGMQKSFGSFFAAAMGGESMVRARTLFLSWLMLEWRCLIHT